MKSIKEFPLLCTRFPAPVQYCDTTHKKAASGSAAKLLQVKHGGLIIRLKLVETRTNVEDYLDH